MQVHNFNKQYQYRWEGLVKIDINTIPSMILPVVKKATRAALNT